MPHVVIEEAGELQILYQAFTPLIQRAGNDILNVREFYLARSGKEALLESVTIEQGAVCNDFVRSSCTRRLSLCVSCLPQILRKYPQ